jgi:hypothetical protein
MVEPPDVPDAAVLAGRRSRWRWPVRAAVAVVVLAAVTVAGVLVAPGGATSAFSTPPGELVAAATGQLRSAPLLRYRGSYLDPAGHVVRLTGDVARSGAAVVDLRSENGGTARLVVTGSAQYLNGDHAWYLEQDPGNASRYDDSWVAVDSTQLVGADLKQMLTPATLAKTLQYSPAGQHDLPTIDLAYRAAQLGGGLAAGVPTPSAATAYVTVDRPYRLVGVDGPLFTAHELAVGSSQVRGVPQVSLTIDQPTGATRRSALGRIAALGKEAAGKATSSSGYATFAVNSISSPPCYVGQACRFEASVSRYGYGPAAPVAATVAILTTSSSSGYGDTLGTCRARTRPLKIGGTGTASCRVGGKLRHWSGAFWYFAIAVDPDLYGDQVDTLLRLYARDEVDALGDLATSPDALAVIDAWESDPGWTVPSLADALTTASTVGLLGPLHRLATSGRFVDDSAAVTAILRALNSNPQSRYADALLDAADRAGRAGGSAGHGQVALGSWQAGNGHTYRADVIDTGAHQLVAEAPVTSAASVPATAGTVRSAAARLGRAPAGYTPVVHLVLAPGHRLYRDGRASLLDSLRASGLTADDLAGADLSITTANDTVTLRPSDFG